MYYNNKSGYKSYTADLRYNHNYRQFPPVDSTLLSQSASESRNLLRDASIVTNKLYESKDFADQLMNAAQESNTEEVNRLIFSLGLNSNVMIKYNPDGIKIEFRPKSETNNICNLSIALRWR